MSRFFTFYLFLLFSFTANAGWFSDEPEEELVQSELSSMLPSYWRIADFDITESENVGTSVEPLYKQRFVAELKLNEDTFEKIGVIKKHNLLDIVARKGKEINVHGVSSSTKKAESWVVKLKLENFVPEVGRPQRLFSGLSVVKGSSEEKQIHSDIAKSKKQERDYLISVVSDNNKTYQGIAISPEGKEREIRMVFSEFKLNSIKGVTEWMPPKGSKATDVAKQFFSGSLDGSTLKITELMPKKGGGNYEMYYTFKPNQADLKLVGSWTFEGWTKSYDVYINVF